jgi:hypothetical protein
VADADRSPDPGRVSTAVDGGGRFVGERDGRDPGGSLDAAVVAGRKPGDGELGGQ